MIGDKSKEIDVAATLAGKTIYIVEDDRFLGNLLIRKIASNGVNPKHFETGEDAIEALKENVPDLVILDLLLPRMNGFEVLEYMKSDKRTNKVPVMVVSNTDQANDKEKVRKLGAEFVTKALVSPDTILKYAAEMVRDGKISPVAINEI